MTQTTPSCYLHGVSHQLEVPQQTKIVNVFALLNFADLKQTPKRPYAFECICASLNKKCETCL